MKFSFDGKVVYLGEPATPDFWARQWLSEEGGLPVGAGAPSHVRGAMRRWVKPGSLCIEAGSGAGNIVHGLNRDGWPCIGIDSSVPLVAEVARVGISRRILAGDVRLLPFPDNSFDCYISQGVIEHFPAGYDHILREMDRILRPGGVALISFPSMNPIRRLKLHVGGYRRLERAPRDEPRFYQFALEPRVVSADLRSLGYRTLETMRYEGMLGVADEAPDRFAGLLLRLYNARRSRAASAIRRTVELGAGLVGYCVQIVARKEGS